MNCFPYIMPVLNCKERKDIGILAFNPELQYSKLKNATHMPRILY
jgi:hypothetical protein